MQIPTNPTVLDLYSGAGGMSLGFRCAGFNLVGAVEIDRWAADTFEANLGVAVTRSRVSELSDSELNSFSGVDVVCGGPPCQGFSISASGRAHANDVRNAEVFQFLRTALRLKPRFILIENVRQFGQYRRASGDLLVEEVTTILHAAGYSTSTHLLNAVSFGVPQNRIRFFLVGARSRRLPRLGRYSSLSDGTLFPPSSPLTVEDALSDLPPVTPGTIADDTALNYIDAARNDYQARMRSTSGYFHNHIPMRHTSRLVERFSRIPIGGNGTSIWDADAPRKRGDVSAVGSRFEQNHRRMNPHAPGPTITAYMYSTCLHPYQHRNITVREAARLQSFPDSFRFTGKRTTLSNKLLERKGLVDDIGLDQLNQVGNAVPPLLAEGLAREILEVLAIG